MPVVATLNGQQWTPEDVRQTVASGIAVATPVRMDQMLEVIRSSHGIGVVVDDQSLTRWQKLLSEREGIYAEPTSAAAFAGLERLAGMGTIDREDLVLVPVTGSGLKDAVLS